MAKMQKQYLRAAGQRRKPMAVSFRQGQQGKDICGAGV